jgi:hypothetical protein
MTDGVIVVKALLEKALRARQEQTEEQNEEEEDDDDEDNVPVPPKKSAVRNQKELPPPPVAVHMKPLPATSSLLQPTAAYKNQSIQKASHEVVSEEEAIRLEEEKRDYIASIRKKFKEQHKMILAQLAEKKREQQEKVK